MTLTEQQRNEVLKAVSQSIIGLRRRISEWNGSDDRKFDAEDSLEDLMEARAVLESQE